MIAPWFYGFLWLVSVGMGGQEDRVDRAVAQAGGMVVKGGMGGMGRPAPSVGMMSGLPLEDPDMDPGRISVRVVDRSLDDSVAGAAVSIRDAATGKVLQKGKTGPSGRVLFKEVLVGSSLVVTASSGGRTARSVVFEMPRAKALRFLLALSVPGRGAGMPGGSRKGGRDQKAGEASDRSEGGGGGKSGDASGAARGGRDGDGIPERVDQTRRTVRSAQAGGDAVPDRTGLWVEFRVRAVEDGKLTVTVTYLLDLAGPDDVAGMILPYPGGFEPMDEKPPAWVQPGQSGLVVQSDLRPGRYSASVTGVLRHDGDTLVVDMTAPVPVRGYGIVVRRYPKDEPAVVGPGVVRRDMGGAYVAWIADRITGRRIRFALVGLRVRSRMWAWLAVALAVGMVLAALVMVVSARRRGLNQD